MLSLVKRSESANTVNIAIVANTTNVAGVTNALMLLILLSPWQTVVQLKRHRLSKASISLYTYTLELSNIINRGKNNNMKQTKQTNTTVVVTMHSSNSF